MKLGLHLPLVLLATAVMAAPVRDSQLPLEKHDHALGDPYTHRAKFKTPFVVKVSTAPTRATKKPLHPAEPPVHRTSWLDRWRTQDHNKKNSGAVQTCFCAGGSVCCNTLRGVNCHGVCGI